jgi:hypothetical protein
MSQIIKRESFDGWHQHILKSASNALLSSKFAVKVRSTDYLAGQPPFVDDLLNLWSEAWIQPAEGPFDTIRQWLESLLPDPIEREYLFTLFAFHCQFPAQKIRVAIMLRGPQGTGKNSLVTILAMICGRRNVRLVGGEALNSRFNEELVNNQVLAIDEVMRRDGWDVANALKPLVSEDRILTEGKGDKRRSSSTPRVVLVLSNDEAPLPVEEGDRRFFVPAYGPPAREPGFYNALYAALPQEVPAFFAALLSRDVSAFSPDAPPPFTASKADLQAVVRPPIERQLREWIADAIGPFAADIVVPRSVVDELRLAGHGFAANEQTVTRALKALGAAPLGQLPVGASWTGRPRCWVVRNREEWQGAGAAAWGRHIALAQLDAGGFRHAAPAGDVPPGRRASF